MAMPLRYNTASQEILLGPFLDEDDGKTAEVSLTINASDIKLFKAGATSEANKNSGGATHVAGGRYYAVLGTADTDTLGLLEINVHVSGALPVRREFVVYPAAVYDALFAGTDNLDVSVTQWAGTNVATPDTAGYPKVTIKSGTGTGEVSLSGGRANANVTYFGGSAGTFASGRPEVNATHWGGTAVASATVGANVTQISGDSVAADNLEAALDGTGGVTITAALAGNVTGNLSGSVGSVTGAVGSVTGNVGGNVVGSVGSIAGVSFPANFGDLAITATTGRVDVALIEGSDATDQINAACDAALADYDAPTKAEMDAGFVALNDLSAAEVNAEVDAAIETYHLDHLLAVTYDPASKPGAADALLNELVESDAGVSRFTANALEQAPTGGSAPSAADIRAEIDANSTQLAAIVADTNELQADWADGGRLDLIVDAILADTAEIGAAGAGLTEAGGTGDHLTGVPWNAAWDAEVQSEVADALGVYDPPTATEMTAAFTEIKGATWATTDTLEAIRDRGDSAWVTATGFSTLDAAGVRTAVGLASANLDTQLADIPTVAEFEARTLPTADYFDPATDAVANVTTVGSVTGAVGSVTAGVTLADDAITASKFDESTAFPLASADSGATAVARVGADGDTLETLSDQLDGVAAKTDNLPSDPADASDVAAAFGTVNSTLATIAGYLDTEISTIVTAVGTTIPGLINGLNDFDPDTDVVAHVTLVDTCTINSDMRGTDGAVTSLSGIATATNVSDAQAAIIAQGNSAWVTATSVTVSDKTGFKLAADGLDLVVPADPSAIPVLGTASVATWIGWFGAATVNEWNVTSSAAKLRNSADSADLASYPHSDDGTTFSSGEPS